jgi:predicted RNA-binding Zn ribbon-like protein
MNIPETTATTPVLLDLVNSRLVLAEAIYDELGDDAAASAWLRAHGGSGSTAEVEGARRAREAFVPFLRGEASAEVFEPWLSAMHQSASLAGGRLVWSLTADDEHAIGVRALTEWDALQSATGSRIRPCANPECQHFLVDHSKANSRKWHSMDSCGNRMKSRRHYARSKELAS